MPRIRLRPSAGVTPTDAGVILRSDLGAFQITGPDVGAFLDQMVPLLDGSRDQEGLVQALTGYSRPSVTAFLELLTQRGLIEAVPCAPARFRGPEEFLRAWSAVPGEVMPRITGARVLVVGLEPWGAVAAIELAAAGIGALHLIDDGTVGPDDTVLLRGHGDAAVARSRREILAAMVAEQAPWCRVEVSPMKVLDAAEVLIAGGPWSLIVAAVPPGDPALMERAARLAQRAGIVSLWSLLAGTRAVLGPLVTPGHTACRICATVEALNPPLTAHEHTVSAPRVGARGQLLGHMVAMEALRVISGYTPSELGGRLLIEDLATHETSFHTLVRFPSCRVCGDAETGSAQGPGEKGALSLEGVALRVGDARGSAAEREPDLPLALDERGIGRG
jgi:molybdopterin-synthase adenylyltransferase